MAGTDERQVVVSAAQDGGWGHRVSDGHADVFDKGTVRIRVVWAGDSKVSGASLFHDEMYESYSRDAATVKAWLKR